MTTIADLNRYLTSFFGSEIVMNHSLWTTGQLPNAGYTVFILDQGQVEPNTDFAAYGLPVKTTSRGSSIVPYMSDGCFTGYGSPGTRLVNDVNVNFANNLPTAKKSSGHALNGQLKSVNSVFVDGHVATHNKSQITCVYFNGGQEAGWFY
jgi:prepilin-type processing-associated H-X9-DG protein